MEFRLWRFRYGLTLGLVALAVGLKFVFEGVIDEESPFLIFFTAVVVSAWIGGLRPGLLATGLSALFSHYLFMTPTHSFLGKEPTELLRLLVFIGEGTLVSVLFNSLHHSKAKLRLAMRSADEARKLAEESNQARKDFIANMSHEIRTPLMAILGFTELIAKPGLPEAERDAYVPKMQANVRALSHLIDDILDITAIERGGLELERKPFGLEGFLRSIEDDLGPVAEQKGTRLEFRTKGFLPLEIETDRRKLQQILTHLISNTLKVTDDGTVSVTVTLTRRRARSDEGGAFPPGASLGFIIRGESTNVAENGDWDPSREPLWPELAVSDSVSGRGVSLPFRPADDVIGPGLPLARRLARALGGDIKQVPSRRGRIGTTFLVTMPIGLAPDFESSVQDVITRALPSGSRVQRVAADASEGEPLKGVKVLLVEDSPDNRLLVSRFLDMAGAKVETAKNGKEGLEKAVRGDFNVVVMDIQMPVLDGNHAAQELRVRNFKRPLIALSAHALREDKKTALESGFDDYLVKPINRRDLIEKVKRYSAFESSRQLPVT